MQKSYRILNLDCAGCAQKLEDAINKIDGVESASISFIMQKLTITASEKNLANIMKQVKKTARRIEPDCEIEL